MIHVCSLARLHATVDETGARHVVTILKHSDRVVLPGHIAPQNHLVLSVDDIASPMDGFVAPGHEHVERLIEFVGHWDRTAPMVVHCFAGISRSTAAAFISLCAINPKADEFELARALRAASPTAYPNRRLVTLGDTVLSRSGRMIAAVEDIGRGEFAEEGKVFALSATNAGSRG